jgi:DNA-binding winged helix-turn-helix (wHTH) protein
VSAARYQFDAFELDPAARRLTRAGAPVTLADRHLDVLHHLLVHCGALVTKDSLITAGWGDVAVTDNSLEQAVSSLRRTLGPRPDGTPYIDTVPRRGYRFTATVTRMTPRATDASLDALLAPHRAWVEGRAALESLESGQIVKARRAFQEAVAMMPEQAAGHVGLANACAMQFEMTRADSEPDTAALDTAATHAREACRLEPQSAEAWATLGFVLSRTPAAVDSVAALKRAVALEPDNWRHHFRLAYATWGGDVGRRAAARCPSRAGAAARIRAGALDDRVRLRRA